MHFLESKDDTLKTFKSFNKRVQNEKGYCITTIRSDKGVEFVNEEFEEFCEQEGITYQFSTPRTSQQNDVAERKNRSLQEMAKTVLIETSIPKYFWAEAINTACYIQSKIFTRPILKKTPYELWKGRQPTLSYFHPFGCPCYILNTKDNLGKFDSTDKVIFLAYSTQSKSYRVYNSRTLTVEESINVRFDDKIPPRCFESLDKECSLRIQKKKKKGPMRFSRR